MNRTVPRHRRGRTGENAPAKSSGHDWRDRCHSRHPMNNQSFASTLSGHFEEAE
jgi:hypothetical protein